MTRNWEEAPDNFSWQIDPDIQQSRDIKSGELLRSEGLTEEELQRAKQDPSNNNDSRAILKGQLNRASLKDERVWEEAPEPASPEQQDKGEEEQVPWHQRELKFFKDLREADKKFFDELISNPKEVFKKNWINQIFLEADELAKKENIGTSVALSGVVAQRAMNIAKGIGAYISNKDARERVQGKLTDIIEEAADSPGKAAHGLLAHFIVNPQDAVPIFRAARAAEIAAEGATIGAISSSENPDDVVLGTVTGGGLGYLAGAAKGALKSKPKAKEEPPKPKTQKDLEVNREPAEQFTPDDIEAEFAKRQDALPLDTSVEEIAARRAAESPQADLFASPGQSRSLIDEVSKTEENILIPQKLGGGFKGLEGTKSARKQAIQEKIKQARQDLSAKDLIAMRGKPDLERVLPDDLSRDQQNVINALMRREAGVPEKPQPSPSEIVEQPQIVGMDVYEIPMEEFAKARALSTETAPTPRPVEQGEGSLGINSKQRGEVDPKLLKGIAAVGVGSVVGGYLAEEDEISGMAAGALLATGGLLALRKMGSMAARGEVDPAVVASYPGETYRGKLDNFFKAPRGVVVDIGAKSVSYLQDVARKSPSFEKFMYTIGDFHLDRTKPRQGYGFFENVYRNNGKFLTPIHDALHDVSSFLGTISSKTNADLNTALRGGKVADNIKNEVKTIRSTLDKVYEYAKSGKIEMADYVPGYLPRMWRTGVFNTPEGMNAWVALNASKGIDELPARKIADSIVAQEGIMLSPYRKRKSEPGDKDFQQERVLKMFTDAELEPFLNNNVKSVLTQYIPAVVRRVEHAKVFGPKLEKFANAIEAAERELKRPFPTSELAQLEGIEAALRGAFNPIKTPVLDKANKAVATTTGMLLLPLATAASLGELFITLERGRLGSNLKAIPEATKFMGSQLVRTVNKKYPKSEALKALEDLGFAFDLSLAEAIKNLGKNVKEKAVPGSLSQRTADAFGGMNNRLTDLYFKANGLNSFNRLVRSIGATVARINITDNLKDLASGKLGKSRASEFTKKLNDLGIDIEAGKRWVAKGAKQDDPFFENVKMGMIRYIDEVSPNPRATNRPLLHSDPHFALLTQLLGFQTVFGNTVMKRWMDKVITKNPLTNVGELTKMTAAAGLMILAAEFGQQVKDFARGREPNKKETPFDRMMRTLQTTGFAGSWQIGINSYLAHKYGGDVVTANAGPAASLARKAGINVYRGVNSNEESSDKSKPKPKPKAKSKPKPKPRPKQ